MRRGAAGGRARGPQSRAGMPPPAPPRDVYLIFDRPIHAGRSGHAGPTGPASRSGRSGWTGRTGPPGPIDKFPFMGLGLDLGSRDSTFWDFESPGAPMPNFELSRFGILNVPAARFKILEFRILGFWIFRCPD